MSLVNKWPIISIFVTARILLPHFIPFNSTNNKLIPHEGWSLSKRDVEKRSREHEVRVVHKNACRGQVTTE